MDTRKLGLISDEEVNKLYNSIVEEETTDYASYTKAQQAVAGAACVAAAASFGFI